MTVDGSAARNAFASVKFKGPQESFEVPLEVHTVAVPARLDIRRAVVSVDGREEGPPKAVIRALADSNVYLVRSKSPMRLKAYESASIPPPSTANRDGIDVITQHIPGDLDWPGMDFAVAAAQKGQWKAIAIVTSMESRDCEKDAIELARKTIEGKRKPQIRAHTAAWKDFWSQSGIEIDDELLQRTWYRGLYFLRCVSKPGVISPGLFAGLINDTPAWHGDYHTNYNLQQTFWGAYAANHPELAEPYDRLMSDYLPRARWLAKQVFDMDGAYYPHVLFAYEPPNPETVKSHYWTAIFPPCLGHDYRRLGIHRAAVMVALQIHARS